MSAARHINLVLLVSAGFMALAAPCLAQTRSEIETASSAQALDLSTRPTEAIRAARAVQAAKTASAAPDGGVEPVIVHPEAQPQARVVASTEAASLTSPDFSARDDQDPLLAVRAGRNRAFGAQSVDNTVAEGFLKVNPRGGATRTDVGLTSVF